MDRFATLYRGIERLTLGAALVGMGFLLGAMTVTVADIGLRRLAGYAMIGTLDMVQLCIMVAACLAIPHDFVAGGHVGVDLATDPLPPRSLAAVKAAAALAGAVFMAAAGWYGGEQAVLQAGYGDSSQTIGIPMLWFWLPLVGGAGLSALAAGAMAVRFALAAVTGHDLVLILARVPVGIAMGAVGALGYGVLNGWTGAAFVMGTAPFESIFPYGLSVIPLFILMGVFSAHAGLSRALFDAVHAMVGHWRGGLAMATVGACAGFGAICGSSLATAATMGRVALPEMRRHGYDDRLASAAIAAGGTLGVMIPPSIILVVYGLMTQQSIGALFSAAILPGLVGTVLYMAAIGVQVWRDPALGPAGSRLGKAQRAKALRDVWPVAGLFSLVIGGIYLGWFSPTEAAAVGAFGAFAVALARGRLSLGVLRACLVETAVSTGMIFLILIGAGVFNFFLETSTLPQLLVQFMGDLGWGRYLVLILLMVFYVVLGCLMDSLSMVLLTVPFIFPLVVSLGFDPVWFGILLVTVVEVGLITPPVGMNLFVLQGVVRDLPLQTIVRGILPFIIADLVRLSLLIGVPGLSLWLPSLMR
jgi:tripartite ATP-independent transporter DctM subunit